MAIEIVSTLAELMGRLGDVPLDRVQMRPAPGTATIQDVIVAQQREGRLCELVDGVLVEKAVGYPESVVAGLILTALNVFVLPRKLGQVSGADGTIELMPDLVRIPDVAFTSRERLRDSNYSPTAVPRLAPNLVVEVLSESNTAREMSVKRQEYFAAGVELVWEVDPKQRGATVYRSLTDSEQLTERDQLDGWRVLPGFELSLAELFG
jgi:Uma2 family endonuclease